MFSMKRYFFISKAGNQVVGMAMVLFTLALPLSACEAPRHVNTMKSDAAVSSPTTQALKHTNAKPQTESRLSGQQCVFNQRRYESGSIIGCTVTPGTGSGCPLGLPMSEWKCKSGRWVLKKASH